MPEGSRLPAKIFGTLAAKIPPWLEEGGQNWRIVGQSYGQAYSFLSRNVVIVGNRERGIPIFHLMIFFDIRFGNCVGTWGTYKECCQTLGLVLRLRVDFVLPLSQEQEEQQEEQLG